MDYLDPFAACAAAVARSDRCLVCGRPAHAMGVCRTHVDQFCRAERSLPEGLRLAFRRRCIGAGLLSPSPPVDQEGHVA